MSARQMQRVGAAMLTLTLLSGCTHTRWVTVPCVAKGQKLPAEPERVGSKLTGQAQEDFKIVAGSAVELRSWGVGLRTILEGCRER